MIANCTLRRNLWIQRQPTTLFSVLSLWILVYKNQLALRESNNWHSRSRSTSQPTSISIRNSVGWYTLTIRTRWSLCWTMAASTPSTIHDLIAKWLTSGILMAASARLWAWRPREESLHRMRSPRYPWFQTMVGILPRRFWVKIMVQWLPNPHGTPLETLCHFSHPRGIPWELRS